MHRTQGEDYVKIDGKRMYQAADPTTGKKATRLSASSMNAIQEEIAGAIEDAGITLNATAEADEAAGYGQLTAAIRGLRDEDPTWQEVTIISGNDITLGTPLQNLFVNLKIADNTTNGGYIADTNLKLSASVATGPHLVFVMPNWGSYDKTTKTGFTLNIYDSAGDHREEAVAYGNSVLIKYNIGNLIDCVIQLADTSTGTLKAAAMALSGDITIEGSITIGTSAIIGSQTIKEITNADKSKSLQFSGNVEVDGDLGLPNGALVGTGCVQNDNLQAGSVTEEKIGTGAVTEDKLAAGAVTTVKIGNGAVTEDKIGNGAVTEDKIGNGAVTEDKIGNGAVTEDKIGDGAVTEDKIADGSITTDKFAFDTSLIEVYEYDSDNTVLSDYITAGNTTGVIIITNSNTTSKTVGYTPYDLGSSITVTIPTAGAVMFFYQTSSSKIVAFQIS